MTTLSVGTPGGFATIAAAVAASGSGDTIAVQAGTYTNDFVTIRHDLNLQSVGGTVNLVATTSPPDGKAIITEGNPGISVSITGFDISGAAVGDGNGAGIRYEGGNLLLQNDTVHDNQDGILSAPDPDGTITIDSSTFSHNGAGDGRTHNIYVGAINTLTVENSTIADAVIGHDIKSRAATTIVTGNTITDGPNGSVAYEIDLPNGGVGVITGNVIQKGVNSTNPSAITYGEEGVVYGNNSLTVSGNTILNDNQAGHTTIAVKNTTDSVAAINSNTLYGFSQTSAGPATESGNVILTTEPALSSLTPSGASPQATPVAATTPDPAPAVTTPPDTATTAPTTPVPVATTTPDPVPVVTTTPDPAPVATTPDPAPIITTAPDPAPVVTTTPDPAPVVATTPDPAPVATTTPDPASVVATTPDPAPAPVAETTPTAGGAGPGGDGATGSDPLQAWLGNGGPSTIPSVFDPTPPPAPAPIQPSTPAASLGMYSFDPNDPGFAFFSSQS